MSKKSVFCLPLLKITKIQQRNYFLCLTSMMLYLLAYKFKILTGANQMSAATRFKAGYDTNLTFQPTGKLYRPYISNNNDPDSHSTSKEATDVSHPRTIIRCDNIEYTKERTKQNKFKLNKLSNFGNYTLYFWDIWLNYYNK